MEEHGQKKSFRKGIVVGIVFTVLIFMLGVTEKR